LPIQIQDTRSESKRFSPIPNITISFVPSRLVADLADQELRGLAARLIAISQVGCSDGKGTGADEIAGGAEDLESIGWVLGDSTLVLEVLGVSKEDSANNLLPRSGVGVLDGGSGQSSTLTVATCHDLAVGALGVGHLEETNHLRNGGRRGTAGEKVAADSGIVWAADSLDPDIVGAVLALQSVTKRCTKSALDLMSVPDIHRKLRSMDGANTLG
jgi:hypothetical protein